MNVLEIFSGSNVFSKTAKKYGHNVFTVDINNFDGTDYVVDILNIDLNKIPFVPDVIWASPPCTGFSVASIGRHWTGGKGAYIPKSDTSRLGIQLLKKTLQIIKFFNPKYFYIENPRGLMRKMDFMKDSRELHVKDKAFFYDDYRELRIPHSPFIRNTITYCQYGETRMKPTDIWTNDVEWKSRSMCKNGDSCHEAAPRGSRTGTQGLKNNYERSKLPIDLCEEIVKGWGDE